MYRIIVHIGIKRTDANGQPIEVRLSQGTRLKLVPGMAVLLAQPSAMPLATSADKVWQSAQTTPTPERSLCHVQLRGPSGCSCLACDENGQFSSCVSVVDTWTDAQMWSNVLVSPESVPASPWTSSYDSELGDLLICAISYQAHWPYHKPCHLQVEDQQLLPRRNTADAGDDSVLRNVFNLRNLYRSFKWF